MTFRTVCLPIVIAAVVASSTASFAAMPMTGAVGVAQDNAVIQIAKKKRKMTRQQELDRSVDSGTVPARYRRSVPREYQQYVPFAKQ